ncbi:hypothetical protein [Streptomyces sp. SID9727]|uniref:hypothetical protein n=1 Tax=Streptomyces sp. SID9727 TaxID=2706114 RepID=UPI001EF31EDA|nr:hypothetical protein [Streptomyces sp. SID9727]
MLGERDGGPERGQVADVDVSAQDSLAQTGGGLYAANVAVNAWMAGHIADPPPGTPYRKQRFHALMTENGTLFYTDVEAATLGKRLRAALDEG